MPDQAENVEVANLVSDVDEQQFLESTSTESAPTETAAEQPTESVRDAQGRLHDAQGRFVPQEKPAEDQLADQPVEPEKPKHSPRMLRMAADLGISEDDAGDYSPEQLEAVIHERHKQLITHARRQQPKPKEPEADAEPEINLGIDADAFPELVAHLKAEAKDKKALQKELAELKAREERREQASQVSQLDQAFAAYPDVFGTESVNELANDDPKMLRRQAALAVMKMGDQSKPLKKLLANAMAVLNMTAAKPTNGVDKDLVYGDKELQRQRKTDTTGDDIGGRLAERQAEWKDAGLAAPSQRIPAPIKPGLPAAKKAFVEEARAAGFQVKSDYDPEEENWEP
jgi:hypothetical protein